jgi:hypothetical protein
MSRASQTPTLTTIGDDYDNLYAALDAGQVTLEQFYERKAALHVRLNDWRYSEPELPTLEEVAEQLEEARKRTKHMAGEFAGSPVWSSLDKLAVILIYHCERLQVAEDAVQAAEELDRTVVDEAWWRAMGAVQDGSWFTLWINSHSVSIRFPGEHASEWHLYYGSNNVVWLPCSTPLERWQVTSLIRVLRADPSAVLGEPVGEQGEQGEQGG